MEIESFSRQVTDDGEPNTWSIRELVVSRGRGWAIGHQERKSRILRRRNVGNGPRQARPDFRVEPRNECCISGGGSGGIHRGTPMVPCKGLKGPSMVLPQSQLVLTVVPIMQTNRMTPSREATFGSRCLVHLVHLH